jgi:apolipoprotein N-acyltransferase
MKLSGAKRFLPGWKNALLAVLSAILLILAFPDFEYWFLAWFGLVPLLVAIEREVRPAGSCGRGRPRSFVLGWIFGFIFFSGTCWWLTYAPIHYAGFPWPLAYFLLFCVTAVVGIFPGIFAAITSVLLRRFGSRAFLAVPFVWVAIEFARYWITGNDWNAIGYSQAAHTPSLPTIIELLPAIIENSASIGGVLIASGIIVGINVIFAYPVAAISCLRERYGIATENKQTATHLFPALFYLLGLSLLFAGILFCIMRFGESDTVNIFNHARVIAIQPNVPMSGFNVEGWQRLRRRQVEQAEVALYEPSALSQKPTTVILPESPMNYQWEEDEEFRQFISAFTAKNNVNVLFNSAEPDAANHKYFNSAVMIDASGREIAQYDKIYLLPFGEAVPAPLENILPGFVGNFSYGRNYDLVPLGDAKAGIMICFESHFGQLSREYVRRGADAIIEMTNDGYLGPTPVLRQHLANAVFRAIETNRPVLRVTNVGITAYINERGEVLDATTPYTEDTRVWPVAKSDGSQTFYVRYGDWFAWVCTAVTIALLFLSFLRRNTSAA